MTSSPRDHLDKARTVLDGASRVVEVNLPALGAREAYLAAFHAAQALIVSRRGAAPRTHNGVHAEFARIVREENVLSREMVRFLSVAYEYKSESDYVVADHAPISVERARRAIDDAAAMLTAIEALLSAT